MPLKNKKKRREYEADWRASNPKYGTNYNRFVRYGVTVALYQQMLEDQGGRCCICGNYSRTKQLSVDHNHATGQVRGLVCQRCNIGISFMEHPLRAAFEAYLDKYKEMDHG